ncbi:MAG: TlpA family protein disulfide reductase [Methylobacterium mesophilicum]|nr:TlpA family protein disulfide reductase [Methylobacterium mesophilicum]
MRVSPLKPTSLAVIAAAMVGAVAGALLLAPEVASQRQEAARQGGAPVQIAGFPFKAGDGGDLTLDSFRGKAVLLNIWATWCPPCRKEMPSLDRLQATRDANSFEVVALSVDKSGAERVKPFYEEIGIGRLKMYLDAPGASMQALKIVGLPTTLLIGPDGRELARWTGPKEWDEPATVAEIDRLLADARKD